MIVIRTIATATSAAICAGNASFRAILLATLPKHPSRIGYIIREINQELT